MESNIPSHLPMRRTPVSANTIANAPFAARPPSPPSVFVPSFVSRWSDEQMSVVPSFENADPLLLTREDLAVITQNHREQIARDNCEDWRYESRREAQQILDFLYLGPSYIAKNKDFLVKKGITLLLAVRDSSMVGTRIMSVERVAQELGIEAVYIDVADHQALIRAFPIAVKTINDHLLSIYHSQAVEVPSEVTPRDQTVNPSFATPTTPQIARRIAIDKDNFRRGKVLVFCETGNDRSASVVAAYLMTVYGMSLVRAVQFISLQRFCASFDEESKLWLQSYEGIIQARRAVHREAAPVQGWQRSKRTRDDVMEEDQETVAATGGDSERFMDRPAFVPFADNGGDVQMG